jgi:hypothetical protein
LEAWLVPANIINMKTTHKLLTFLRRGAMLCLPVLVLATIEIPARASNASATPVPAGLFPTVVGLATLLALRRQKKNGI